jgi:hypothetical protein
VEISALGLQDRKTLVILGAGATRGASFVEGSALPPPVDRDFFRILQMSETGRSEKGRNLLEHVRGVYGPALDVGMETVFTNLNASATFSEQLKVDPGPVVKWPKRLIEAFNVVLPRLLKETIGSSGCEFHDLVANKLGVIDCVISLNYDCVIDRALSEHAGSRFAAGREGYGVEISSGADAWKGTAPGPTPKNSIELLKLHGSLNWGQASVPLELRTDIYKQVALGVIQPPLTNKPVENEPFATIWRNARKSVRTARRLILIGYSMPIADGLVRSLLSTDLKTVLREVIVVEPDAGTRDRHIEFFTRLAQKAQVFAFSDFAEFARLLK